MPGENGALEQKAELKGTSSVRAVAWHPAQADTALSVEGAKLLQWRLGGASAEVTNYQELADIALVLTCVQTFRRNTN